MKILVIGFIVLFSWSAFSTHYYVCNIKGLCTEGEIRQAILTDTLKVKNTYTSDSLSNTLAGNAAAIPESLIVYFEFDRSDFNSDGRTDNWVIESVTFLNHNNKAGVRITGYTDAVGSDAYNEALGYRRAQSALKYLQKKGLPAERVTVISKGEKEPVGDNETIEGRANNRRTSISVIK